MDFPSSPPPPPPGPPPRRSKSRARVREGTALSPLSSPLGTVVTPRSKSSSRSKSPSSAKSSRHVIDERRRAALAIYESPDIIMQDREKDSSNAGIGLVQQVVALPPPPPPPGKSPRTASIQRLSEDTMGSSTEPRSRTILRGMEPPTSSPSGRSTSTGNTKKKRGFFKKIFKGGKEKQSVDSPPTPESSPKSTSRSHINTTKAHAYAEGTEWHSAPEARLGVDSTQSTAPVEVVTGPSSNTFSLQRTDEMSAIAEQSLVSSKSRASVDPFGHSWGQANTPDPFPLGQATIESVPSNKSVDTFAEPFFKEDLVPRRFPKNVSECEDIVNSDDTNSTIDPADILEDILGADSASVGAGQNNPDDEDGNGCLPSSHDQSTAFRSNGNVGISQPNNPVSRDQLMLSSSNDSAEYMSAKALVGRNNNPSRTFSNDEDVESASGASSTIEAKARAKWKEKHQWDPSKDDEFEKPQKQISPYLAKFGKNNLTGRRRTSPPKTSQQSSPRASYLKKQPTSSVLSRPPSRLKQEKEKVFRATTVHKKTVDTKSVALGLSLKAHIRTKSGTERAQYEPYVDPDEMEKIAMSRETSCYGVLDETKLNDPIQIAGIRLLSKNAIPIQCVMRGYLAQKYAIDRFCALISIQCYFRRWKCEAFKLAHTYSISKIQAVFRGWLVRDTLEDEQYCANQLQRVIRSFLAIKLMGKLRIEDRAATKIQTTWRSYGAQLRYQFQVVDIILVQCQVRSWLAKRSLLRKQDQKLFQPAAIKIQSLFRRYSARMNLLFALVNIITVQSLARRWLATNRFIEDWTLQTNNYATREMQGTSRIKQAHRRLAAIKIQKTWRGFWGFSHYVIMMFEVCKIQALFRGRLGKINANHRRQSITMLQSVAREYLARKKIRQSILVRTLVAAASLSMRESIASTNIARWWIWMQEIRTQDIAARSIQRFFIMVKEEVDDEIKRQHTKMKKKKKKKKLERQRRKKNEKEDMMFERAWLNVVEEPTGLSRSFDTGSVLSPSSLSDRITISSDFKNTGGLMGKGNATHGSNNFPAPSKRQVMRHEGVTNRDSKSRDPIRSKSNPKPRDSYGRKTGTNRSKSNSKPRGVGPRGYIVEEGGHYYDDTLANPEAMNISIMEERSDVSAITSTVETHLTSVFSRKSVPRQGTFSRKELSDDLSLEEAYMDTKIIEAREKKRIDEKYLQRHGIKFQSRRVASPHPVDRGSFAENVEMDVDKKMLGLRPARNAGARYQQSSSRASQVSQVTRGNANHVVPRNSASPRRTTQYQREPAQRQGTPPHANLTPRGQGPSAAPPRHYATSGSQR